MKTYSFAYGSGDERELRTLVTDAVYERVRVENHDCEAPDLVYLGTTPHGTPVSINRTAAEADLVVCLGAVTHHVMAGFGGGRKSILPGISGRETIFHNHAFSLDAAALHPRHWQRCFEGQPAARGYRHEHQQLRLRSSELNTESRAAAAALLSGRIQ